MYTDKITQAVAEAVKQILATEKLHPNQQKLDVHEPEKDELTSKDFEMLRKGKKAEVKEGWQDMLDDVKKRAGPQPSGGSGVKQGSRYGGSKQKDEPEDKKPMKEDLGQIDELSKTTLGSYIKKAANDKADRAYGNGFWDSRGGRTTYPPEDTPIKNKIEVDQKQRNAGIKRAVNKLTKENIEQIDELAISPQARASAKERETSYHDDTEFPARPGQDLSGHTVSKLKTMHRHHLMTAGHADVSDPEEKGEYHNAMKSARRIKNEIDRRKSVKKEDLDINAINGVQMSTIEEKHLTEPETNKKEEVVKSMKKGLAGFKARYGDRAKSVMYATATKIAKDKA